MDGKCQEIFKFQGVGRNLPLFVSMQLDLKTQQNEVKKSSRKRQIVYAQEFPTEYQTELTIERRTDAQVGVHSNKKGQGILIRLASEKEFIHKIAAERIQVEKPFEAQETEHGRTPSDNS